MTRLLVMVFCTGLLLTGCSRKTPAPPRAEQDDKGDSGLRQEPSVKPRDKGEDPDSEEARKARATRFLEEARKALAARKHEEAIKAYTAAASLLPKDDKVKTDKARAEQAFTAYKKEQAAGFLSSARTDLNARQFQKAIAGFKQVQRLDPTSTEVAVLLRQAEAALAAAVIDLVTRRARP